MLILLLAWHVPLLPSLHLTDDSSSSLLLPIIFIWPPLLSAWIFTNQHFINQFKRQICTVYKRIITYHYNVLQIIKLAANSYSSSATGKTTTTATVTSSPHLSLSDSDPSTGMNKPCPCHPCYHIPSNS